MTKKEYLLHAVEKGYIYNRKWYYSVFALPAEKIVVNDYIKRNDQYYVNIDKEWIPLIDAVVDKPIFDMQDIINIEKGTLSNLKKDIKTTVGIFLINKLLIEDVIGKEKDYVNDNMSIGSLEKELADYLYKDIITIKDYTLFVDTSSFLEGLSRLTSVSATEKGMLPPKGLDKFKKELDKEFKEKYGEDWRKDRSYVIQYIDRLKEFDAEFMKDDPSMGKLTSGKLIKARTKLYLTYGAEAGFDKTGRDSELIEEPLSDGYPEDPKKLTTMFNTSRSGSYDRGAETQKGGATAKDLLRATSSMKIKDGDCGTTIGKDITVTSDNYSELVGRYIIKNSKPVELEDTKSLIGKTITVRSPQYCKFDESNICTICTGKKLANYKTGISLLVTDVSGIMLNTSMANIHGKDLKTIKVSMSDILS